MSVDQADTKPCAATPTESPAGKHPADGLGAQLINDVRYRIEDLLDEYRNALNGCVDGLTEEEARLRLVSSKTTLLGLLKHATYLEGFYFDRAISGRSFTEIGIASTPDRSFTLARADTISSVQQEHRRRCEASRTTTASLAFDATVHRDRVRSVWAIQLQMLRELAQHAGHADILREQVLAGRPDSPTIHRHPPERLDNV